MKKIWQKSLASMVSAALCLTAFVGCLTVNAATAYTGTITSTGATVAPTDAEATVKVTLASEALANTVAVQISSKYGALTAVKEVDTATEYYVDQDEIKLDEGKFFVHAKTNAADKGFTTAELVLTFDKAADVVEKDYEITIKAFAGHDGATYNEDTIDYVAEKPIYIKVASSHTHTWDAGVMTTMPTTTSDGAVSDGVVTYTCECGATKTEAFAVSGTITDNTSKILADVGLVKTQYSVKISAEVFSSLKAKNVTGITFGMLLTKDGSAPSFENTATSKLYEYTGNIPDGKAGTATGYFQNMNFNQMGLTLSFRPFVKFTYQGQTCYCYGNTYARDFISLISSNADEKSIALVDLYNSVGQASNVNIQCSGSVLESGNNTSITTRDDKTFYNMAATKIQYGVQIPADVFSGIKAENGTGINFGMLLTKDGTAPSFENTATSILYKYNSNIPAGKNATASGYFQNMNLKQMGQTLTFRPYVSYTNSNGEVTYIYGDAVSFVYIDILRTLEADTYASALVSYYDTYIVAN